MLPKPFEMTTEKILERPRKLKQGLAEDVYIHPRYLRLIFQEVYIRPWHSKG